MIRIFNKQLVAVENGAAKNVATVYCNSTDTKPTIDLANGSTLTEVDTGKNYLFNEATSSWVEVSGGGGSVNTHERSIKASLDELPEALYLFVARQYGEFNQSKYQRFLFDWVMGNYSMMISVFQGQSTVFIAPIYPSSGYIVTQGCVADFSRGVFLSMTYYTPDDLPPTIGVAYANMLTGTTVTDIKANLANFTYDLDIYIHPMPLLDD